MRLPVHLTGVGRPGAGPVLLTVNSETPPDPPAYGVVESVGGGIYTPNGDTGVVTLTGDVVAGSTLVLVGGHNADSGRVASSVADSKSNTWTLDDARQFGSSRGTYLASCPVVNALEAGDTVTITFTGSVSWSVSHVYVVGGIDASSGDHKVNGATGFADNISATLPTTTVNDCVIFGVAIANTSNSQHTINPDFTPLVGQVYSDGSNGLLVIGYRMVSSTGDYPYGVTAFASGVICCLSVAAYAKAA